MEYRGSVDFAWGGEGLSSLAKELEGGSIKLLEAGALISRSCINLTIDICTFYLVLFHS